MADHNDPGVYADQSTHEESENMVADPAHDVPTSDLEQEVRCRRAEGGKSCEGERSDRSLLTHHHSLLLQKYAPGVVGCPQAQACPIWMCDEGVVSILGGGEARHSWVRTVVGFSTGSGGRGVGDLNGTHPEQCQCTASSRRHPRCAD